MSKGTKAAVKAAAPASSAKNGAKAAVATPAPASPAKAAVATPAPAPAKADNKITADLRKAAKEVKANGASDEAVSLLGKCKAAVDEDSAAGQYINDAMEALQSPGGAGAEEVIELIDKAIDEV